MIFASVCSGIGAPEVAWRDLGWSCRFMSEIDPFASRVLAARFPGVPNLGDFTKIEESAGPVDLLVGGTPCQSFSDAGARAGLEDPRGNLALEFVRLARRLRARWILWENVPGVLSSKGGRDFGTILGAMGECGYGWAYRIVDAQGFGLPQRRRRVFVVGCAGGSWQRAAVVLLESACLRWNLGARREAREEFTPPSSGDLGSESTGHRGVRSPCLTGRPHRGVDQPIAYSSPLAGHHHRNDHTMEPIAIQEVRSARNAQNGIGESGDPMFTLLTRSDHAVAFVDPLDVDREIRARSAKESPVAFHVTQDPIMSSDATQCLARKTTIGVVAWDEAQITSVHNRASVREGQPSPTLARTSRPRVAGPFVPRRLTPREWERLQGLPDDWTAIDGADDTPRYAAIGNSMAVAVIRWIGERIALVDLIVAPDDFGGAP